MKDWAIQVLKLAIKFLAVFLFLYTTLSLATNYLGPIKFSLNTKNLDQRNLFTVEGEGKVTVKPDISFVSLGMIIQNQSVTAGQKQANEVINKIVASLRSLGIDERDVKTSSYNIYPNYNYNSGRQTLNGYNINIELSVKVRDLEKINQVIDTATAQGINQVGGVSFDVEKKEDFLNQARTEAVKVARGKAQRLAGLAGLRLGRIVNVRESTGELPRPLIAVAAEKGIGGAGETQVQPGSTEIKVTISLDYETL